MPERPDGHLDARSRHLRRLVIRGLAGAGRGHLGPALSLIEILRVLYDDVMHVPPAEPSAAERDRIILSKGHGCLALYALLADKGFFPAEWLDEFCKFGAPLGGHPEAGEVPGVEASTGALGHGLAIGVGMALAARLQQRPSRVAVVMGDGEINEGAVWEAALVAAKHRLSRLVAVIDVNGMQASGPTAEVLDMAPLAAKWESFGFFVQDIDGHDVDALRGAFGRCFAQHGRPSALLCRTTKGKGVSFVENNADWHHKNQLKGEETAALLRELGEHHA